MADSSSVYIQRRSEDLGITLCINKSDAYVVHDTLTLESRGVLLISAQ